MSSEPEKIDMTVENPEPEVKFFIKSENYGSKAPDEVKSWTVPKTGIYKIECCGASNFCPEPMRENFGGKEKLAFGGLVSGLFDLDEVFILSFLQVQFEVQSRVGIWDSVHGIPRSRTRKSRDLRAPARNPGHGPKFVERGPVLIPASNRNLSIKEQLLSQ